MSVNIVEDEYGLWEKQGIFKFLREPSESFLKQLQDEEYLKIEEEMLEMLKPTNDEIRKAETELTVLELLMEVELI